MSKQNKGALSSNNVQEKLSQGLAANKNNNRSRYVASRLPKTITKRSRTVP